MTQWRMSYITGFLDKKRRGARSPRLLSFWKMVPDTIAVSIHNFAIASIDRLCGPYILQGTNGHLGHREARRKAGFDFICR